MLHDSKDTQIPDIIKRKALKNTAETEWLGNRPSITTVMREVPYGKSDHGRGDGTISQKLSGADFTEPITVGILCPLPGRAISSADETPYWRTLKANGEPQ